MDTMLFAAAVETAEHIFHRFMLHMGASIPLYIAAFLTIDYWIEKHQFKYGRYIVPAVILALVMMPQEAWHVSRGQSLTKAVYDFTSWGLGAGISAIGLRYFYKSKRSDRI